MPTSKEDFRGAMARLGSAVSIITTDGPGGRCGFTASAVCSVTDSPPTVLICMNRSSQQQDVFSTNKALCVNVLASTHSELSAVFAGQRGLSMQERFHTAQWSLMPSGIPALSDAVVCLDCRTLKVIEHGTHNIFLAQVETVYMGSAQLGGLIWFGRSYHGVGSAEPVSGMPDSVERAM